MHIHLTVHETISYVFDERRRPKWSSAALARMHIHPTAHGMIRSTFGDLRALEWVVCGAGAPGTSTRPCRR
jgi:hypothetical protein